MPLNSMTTKSAVFCVIMVAVFLEWINPLCAATYKDDIGFTELQAELDGLGESIPDGTGVAVTQVEAEVTVTVDEETGETVDTWIPNEANSDFAGKIITFKSSPVPAVPSGHATSVGQKFYGNSDSIAPGIGSIDAYSAGHWLGSGFLASGMISDGNPVQPHYSLKCITINGEDYCYIETFSSPSRIANHSWAGNVSTSDLLRRLDFVVENDEYIQIAALSNDNPLTLLSNSFNAITVGKTDGGHPNDTLDVDTIYIKDRTCPLLVVPMSKTSYANPIVASAAALLVQAGQDAALSTDPYEQSTQNRDGDAIANAERSEVVKAALLAGADRVTSNTWSSDDILDYCQDSDNGLDRRFGAGQVNVYHSYQIIAAGEQNSAEDDSESGGQIGTYGFDFDPAFGDDGTGNDTASYTFTVDQDRSMLYASLVWNLDIDGGVYYNYEDTATLYDFDLTLQDVTDENNPIKVAASTSTIDNTENLWVPLKAGHTYRLLVSPGADQEKCLWDYALAWRITMPPDSDEDSLPDDWEVYNGLDHLIADSDGDGMTDGWEVTYDMDPLSDDSTSDADEDQLANLDEFSLGTNPLDEDSDDDGYTDGEEVVAGSDPLDADDYPQIVSVPAVGTTGLLAAMATLLGAVFHRLYKPHP